MTEETRYSGIKGSPMTISQQCNTSSLLPHATNGDTITKHRRESQQTTTWRDVLSFLLRLQTVERSLAVEQLATARFMRYSIGARKTKTNIVRSELLQGHFTDHLVSGSWNSLRKFRQPAAGKRRTPLHRPLINKNIADNALNCLQKQTHSCMLNSSVRLLILIRSLLWQSSQHCLVQLKRPKNSNNEEPAGIKHLMKNSQQYHDSLKTKEIKNEWMRMSKNIN